MGKGPENIFGLQRHTDDQSALEKMLIKKKKKKRCSSSLTIRETQKKPQWDIISHLSEWLASKRQ